MIAGHPLQTSFDGPLPFFFGVEAMDAGDSRAVRGFVLFFGPVDSRAIRFVSPRLWNLAGSGST